MYVNGLVIQKYVSDPYKGIDGCGYTTGENWYFNGDEQLSKIFEPFYEEHIDMTFMNLEDHSWVSACNNMDYINRYVAESKKRGIKYRILLCESEIPNPIFNASELKMKFLGYDYAYARGDNYSAVYNEVPYVFPQFKLNCNGLFDTEEEIREYLFEREKFKESHPPLTLEIGDFVIFKLHEVYL